MVGHTRTAANGGVLKSVLVAAAAVLALAGCSQNAASPDKSLLGNGDGSGYGRDGRGGKYDPNGRLAKTFGTTAGDLVYFSSDSSDLTPEAEQTMANQVRWLQGNQGQTVMIEGHADERGTREYNLALGAKRAQTVRNRLIQGGVQAARIRTLSYGKERPVAVCDDISCWSQNRRAQTVLSGGNIASR
jgi:peptidoglycan-associated lipoprotein